MLLLAGGGQKREEASFEDGVVGAVGHELASVSVEFVLEELLSFGVGQPTGHHFLEQAY